MLWSLSFIHSELPNPSHSTVYTGSGYAIRLNLHRPGSLYTDIYSKQSVLEKGTIFIYVSSQSLEVQRWKALAISKFTLQHAKTTLSPLGVATLPFTSVMFSNSAEGFLLIPPCVTIAMGFDVMLIVCDLWDTRLWKHSPSMCFCCEIA